MSAAAMVQGELQSQFEPADTGADGEDVDGSGARVSGGGR